METLRASELASEIRALGVNTGDTLLVRAAARQIGLQDPARTLHHAIRSAIGESGTVVALAFTRQAPFWNRPSDYTYDRNAQVTSGGAVAKIVVENPNSERSAHPTNSFAAIGPKALLITSNHGPKQTSFAPMQTLISLRAKMLLVGCVDSSPGFSTVHLAQEHLGLASKSLLSGLMGAYYRTEAGERRWFARRDIPGCSLGFSKAYPYYDRAGILSRGFVGNAESLCVPCSEAYNVDLSLLRADPNSLLCDNPTCIFCGTRTYNVRRWVRLGLRFPLRTMKSRSIRAQ
jgi:aminoglycoside 3-N-acetyltransferase